MKINICERPKPADKPYPKLMQSAETGRVVLFISKGKGTILATSGIDSTYSVGYSWCDVWRETFEDFYGSITLSND